MEKRWIPVVSLVLNVFLLVLLLLQGSRLEQLGRSTANDVASTMTQVRRIWEQVDALQTQLWEGEKLIADYSLEPTGLDMEAHALLADVALQLKEWGADTSAVLQVELAGDRIAFPMTAAGDGVFTASVSLPVEQKEDTVPVLTLLAETGGVTVREDVDNIPRTFDLMPVARGVSGGGSLRWRDGQLLLPSGFSFTPYDFADNNITVQEPQFRLYRNGEMVLKEEAVHRARNHRIPHCYYLRETNEDGRGQEIPVEGVPGDIILLTFSCRDEYGLEYEFYIEGWEIGEDDVENYEADLLWYIPQLTWPE